MILTGPEIEKAQVAGDISITPFDAACLNPNSYNYHLGRKIICLTPTEDGRIVETQAEINETGLKLLPGSLYLGVTSEKIGSRIYAMTLLGRSSVGRLGIFLNATADLGHIGSQSHWTLEISVVQPIRVFPDMRIGQIAFWAVHGPAEAYSGRYMGDASPFKSKDQSLKLLLSEQGL